MPEIEVAGTRVHYRDQGDGPTVLLGHSSTGTGGQWRGLIERLRPRFRLIAPDHLGYGRSGSYRGGRRLMAIEVAAVAALADLATSPLHLVGHSYGGAILARLALADPGRVRSLTLIEPTLFGLLAPAGRQAAHDEIVGVSEAVVALIDGGRPEAAARRFIDYWTGPGSYDAMSDKVRPAVAAAMPKLRAEWADAFVADEVTPEGLAGLAAPERPTLLITGAETTIAARGVVEILREVWPEARTAEIAGAGHMAPVTHAEPVNAVIARFLEAT